MDMDAFEVGEKSRDHISGHRELAENLIARIVHDEIVEVYDQLESLVNRISVSQDSTLHANLDKAKAYVWAARMCAEDHL